MYTVPMALVDFIPVFFFLVGSIVLQRCLYNKMSKGAFALFAAGTINVFIAGFLKALYKLLYAAGVCNFERLNVMFFPYQSIGFVLAAIGLVAMMTARQGEGKIYSVALPLLPILLLDADLLTATPGSEPPLYEGTIIFIMMMVIGLGTMDVIMAIIGFKMKKPGAAICFIVSCLFSMMMGYLATKTFDNAILNWMAELVNTIGQALLMLGALTLKKAGLADFEIN